MSQSVSPSAFSSQSSRYSKSQIIRDRELKFTPLNMSHVMCQVSCVTCHVSCFTCHMSCVTCHIFCSWQSGEAYPWRVCYQRGLPRLVFRKILMSIFCLRLPSLVLSKNTIFPLPEPSRTYCKIIQAKHFANIIYCSQTSQLWSGSTGFCAESTWTLTLYLICLNRKNAKSLLFGKFDFTVNFCCILICD